MGMMTASKASGALSKRELRALVKASEAESKRARAKAKAEQKQVPDAESTSTSEESESSSESSSSNSSDRKSSPSTEMEVDGPQTAQEPEEQPQTGLTDAIGQWDMQQKETPTAGGRGRAKGRGSNRGRGRGRGRSSPPPKRSSTPGKARPASRVSPPPPPPPSSPPPTADPEEGGIPDTQPALAAPAISHLRSLALQSLEPARAAKPDDLGPIPKDTHVQK